MKYNIFLLLVFYYPIILFSQQNQSIGNKGVKDGFGVLENKGHGVYRGNFVNSIYEGYGEYYFNNGSVYKGNFKNGLYEGESTFYYADGGVKVANFKEGKEISVISNIYANEIKVGCVSGDCQNGIGKYILNNGEYEGSFLYGKQSGQGKFTCPNGDRYEGQYSDGNKNGYGILSQANGKKYEGNYKNGQKSGIGTFYDLDGNKYIGNWTEGQKNGMGEFYYSDGSYYVGEFVNGRRTGNGKLVFTNGQIQEGLFENDIYKGVSTSNTVTQNTIVSPPPVDKNQVSVVKTQVDPRFTTNLKSVVIGTQTWTTENLNVSTFRNGDPIPEAKTKEEWKKADGKRVPAWCNYNFEAKNGEKYGKLYNWYAVNDPRGLAPFGFHVSSANEWGDLFEFLYTGTEGGQEAAFPKMKMVPIYEMQTSYREIGGYKETKQCTHCSYWTEKQKEYNYCQVCRNDRRVYTGRYIPKETKKETKKVNVGWDGNNSSGFSALPGGTCTDYGHDGYSSTSWWSTTGNWNSQEEDGYAVSYLLPNGNDYHDFSYVKDKGHGFYVRCIKD